MKHTLQIALIAGALLGVACGGDEAAPAPVETTAPEPEVAQRPEPVPEPEPAAVVVSETTLPVAEDFEAEMDTAVTADNYRAELDAVLAELDAP